MSYREEFIRKTQEIFKTETAAYRRREKAQELIIEYMDSLGQDLYDETEATGDQFDIDYEVINLRGRRLTIAYGKNSITIYMTDLANNTTHSIDLLEDDGKAYMSKKYNRPLSEELLDNYLEHAFAAVLV